VVVSELFIYSFIACSCFTVSMIKINKISRAHELLFWRHNAAKTVWRPSFARAHCGACSCSAPPDLLTEDK